MGLNEDLKRFQEVGEERRDDLADFIRYGDLGKSREGAVRIPIKFVELPEFAYEWRDMGGVGQGDVTEGSGLGRPQPGEEESGEAGSEGGSHEYYEMDPEEFAEELDDALGLDLEPKGKEVVQEREGSYTDIARAGPDSMLDLEFLFREGLKRQLVSDFDEEYVREALKVKGWGPSDVFAWAREERIPVSRYWIETASVDIPPEEAESWASIDEMMSSVEHTPAARRLRTQGIDRLPFRRQDERFRHPRVVREQESSVVVVNIRDVSGSMREEKRELVERTFAPLDWYLQGKYDHAEFVYIAHDAEAWVVEREEFFGIRSGGGTRISSAYELAAEILEESYPWTLWNRYVFVAGDSENSSRDTAKRVIPAMEELEVNLQAYVETQPGGRGSNATHAEEVEEHFSGAENIVVTRVHSAEDVLAAIESILRQEVPAA